MRKDLNDVLGEMERTEEQVNASTNRMMQLLEAAQNLAKEIMEKPDKTDAELELVRTMALFMLHMIVDGR